MKTYDLNQAQRFNAMYDREYEQSEWIKPGFRKGTVGAIVAAGGSSKTMYSLQMSMDIACGHEVDKGGVLYLPAEDPMEEIGERVQHIADIGNFNNKQRADLEKNFVVWPLMGEMPNLIESDGDEKWPLVDAICEAANLLFKDEPLRLVVFDTLRRFSIADENDGGQMSNVLSCMETICKRTGASCYFLHHASKGAILTGKVQEQQAARGSSVLSDNIRYQEFLSVMDQEFAEKHSEAGESTAIGVNRKSYVLWGVSKQNHGEPVPPQWYKRGEFGVLQPVEIVPFEKKKGNKKEL